ASETFRERDVFPETVPEIRTPTAKSLPRQFFPFVSKIRTNWVVRFRLVIGGGDAEKQFRQVLVRQGTETLGDFMQESHCIVPVENGYSVLMDGKKRIKGGSARP